MSIGQAVRAAISKTEMVRADLMPGVDDCVIALAHVKERLVYLGWRFDVPPEPGLYDVICSGFPGRYDGQFLPDYMGSGCWEVADPHMVGAGDVLCWRPKDWSP